MAVEFGQYRLRCELRGHEEDVRGICICGDSGIGTGSRDKTVRFWSVDETDNRKYVLKKMLIGHNSFVGPLAWMPPSAHMPEGGLVSGGMDTLVIAWDLSTAQAIQTMKGHQLQVTGITLDDQGDILSASIDWPKRMVGKHAVYGTLGIGHQFSSFIWLCGPITGLVVQPLVGVWSDKCQSIYGRRRPFIFSGALMICFAVSIIGFSADIGYLLGDTHESCNTYKGTRPRAAVVFVIGFWMLDLANNTVGGPARALLADLSGPEQRNISNAIFTSWLAFGNILGFSAGASGKWHIWFPFLTTKACCDACGNLKAAFMVAVVFLLICTAITLYFAQEIPLAAKPPQKISDSAPLLPLQEYEFSDTGVTNPKLDGIHADGNGKESPLSNNDAMVQSPKMEDVHEEFKDGSGGVLVNILTSMRHLPPTMKPVLLVMALSWLSWFPFFLFDTDWMGREVYQGDPKGNATEAAAYQKGVQEGAFGLLLNSVVLGVGSFLIDPLCRWRGSKDLWATSNFIVFICMASTAVISAFAVSEHHKGIQYMIGNFSSVKAASVALFALLGFPLAITYSIPFSVTAELTADAGGGQGLATGVLNLAIVIPQIIVALGAGPWDALFGGGNVPAFVLAALFALAAGIIAVIKLPNLSSTNYKPAVMHGFG